MREIKFRAWNGMTQSWLNRDLYLIDESGLPVDVDPLGDVTPLFGVFIQQYTGLKDKNGKEIYEGDVLKSPYPNCKNIEIKWMTGGCCNFVATGWDWDQECIKNFEVIGNIYENPELI